jgi:hypothetical protein
MPQYFLYLSSVIFQVQFLSNGGLRPRLCRFFYFQVPKFHLGTPYSAKLSLATLISTLPSRSVQRGKGQGEGVILKFIAKLRQRRPSHRPGSGQPREEGPNFIG